MADVVPIRTSAGDFEKAKKLTSRRVLNGARGCDEILVIGLRNGDLIVRGSPNDPGNAMWLMELAKRRLTRGFD